MSAAELKRATVMSEADPRVLSLPQSLMSHPGHTDLIVDPSLCSLNQYLQIPQAGDVQFDQECIGALMQL